MLGRLLIRKPCRFLKRKFSTPPSSSSSQPGGLRGAPTPKKPSTGVPNSSGPTGKDGGAGSGGSGLTTAFVFTTLAGLVFTSYKLETDDNFEKSTHKVFPGIVGMLSPLGGLLRAIGIVTTKNAVEINDTIIKDEIIAPPAEAEVKVKEEIVVSKNIME